MLREPKILQDIRFSRRDRGRGTIEPRRNTADREVFWLCGYRTQKYFPETACFAAGGVCVWLSEAFSRGTPSPSICAHRQCLCGYPPWRVRTSRFGSLFQITYEQNLESKALSFCCRSTGHCLRHDHVLLILFWAQGQMSQVPCGFSGRRGSALAMASRQGDRNERRCRHGNWKRGNRAFCVSLRGTACLSGRVSDVGATAQTTLQRTGGTRQRLASEAPIPPADARNSRGTVVPACLAPAAAIFRAARSGSG